MALDALSIPAMSTECERVFSSSKKLFSPQRCHIKKDLIEATECLKAWWGCGMIVQWAAAASTTRLIRAETRIFLFHSLPFYCDGASWSLSPLWTQEPSFEHPPEIARTHRKKTKQAFHPTCLRVPPSPICVMPSRSYNLPFGIPLSLPQ
jgi:hypothetical protein